MSESSFIALKRLFSTNYHPSTPEATGATERVVGQVTQFGRESSLGDSGDEEEAQLRATLRKERLQVEIEVAKAERPEVSAGKDAT